MPPPAYASARLRAIAAEMCLLELRAKRHETAFAKAGGDVGEEFQEAWDAAIADWWVLAEEAEALDADPDHAGAASAGLAEAMARMLQVSLPGGC